MRISKFFVVFSVLCLSFGISHAQEPNVDTMAFKHYEVGLYASLGASVFKGDVPNGSKTDVHFPAFGFGATGIYSFHPYWGFALSLGYESRGMYFHKQDSTGVTQDITLNYFSIAPSIKFKQFLLGVNINIPVGISQSYQGGNDVSPYEYKLAQGNMNTIVDIRAEGMLPITENETGALYLILNASYCLTSTIGGAGFNTIGSGTGNPQYQPITNSPVPMAQIGFSYLFAPGGKTH